MIVVDKKRNWIIDGKIVEAGTEFDADAELMTRIAKESSTLFEVDKLPAPQPEPEPIKVEDVEEDPIPEAVVPEGSGEEQLAAIVATIPKDDEDTPPSVRITAIHKGGGYYELSTGETLRRKDFPEGVEIIQD